MNSSRDEFLAGAGFAGDQNRRVAAGDLRHLGQDGGQRGRAADNLFEHRGLVDFFAEGYVFLLEPLLISFALFDIRARSVPTENSSLVVSERVATNQKPTIDPVILAEPHFDLKCSATRDSKTPLRPQSFRVVGMNLVAGPCLGLEPLIKSEAKVIKAHAVEIKTLAVGPENGYKLRREVQRLTELCFLNPDLFLGRPALGYVRHRSDKLPIAGCILYSVRYRVDVLDSPVRQ